jgi:hypothetical protein
VRLAACRPVSSSRGLRGQGRPNRLDAITAGLTTVLQVANCRTGPIDESEADTPFNGVTDAVKPWTIKSIATEARDLAIMAARREGLTVGIWLERVIRAATAGEFAADRQGRPMSDRALTTVSQGQPAQSNHGELRSWCGWRGS